jgi:hypothetical protein
VMLSETFPFLNLGARRIQDRPVPSYPCRVNGFNVPDHDEAFV